MSRRTKYNYELRKEILRQYFEEQKSVTSLSKESGEQINYVPQTAKLNNGEWKSMEKKWKDALSEGKKVEVDIQIIYDSNSKRPKRFEVQSIIVDKKGIQEIKKYKFYN